MFILGLLGICQFAALVTFWPYDLSLSLTNYAFDLMDGGGWDSYYNSLQLALLNAVAGTIVVFVCAYMVAKTKGFETGRALLHMIAMMRMAFPAMVPGFPYILFLNHP